MKKRLLTNEDFEHLDYKAGCKVSFTEEQDLTDEQKEIARKNIGIDELPSGGGGTSGENSGGSGTPGEDGFSPIAKVTQTTTGATISITDKKGTTTATINHGKDGKDGQDGSDGQDGYTPRKGIDYFDGEDGYSPKVSVSKIGKTTTITITDAYGTKTATIKDGEDGASGSGGTGGTGADGEDGIGIASIVQTTKSTEDDGINIITITLTDGSTHTFEVQNGSKGSDGSNGKDGQNGYTPQKGVDYFDGEDGQNGEDGYSPTAKVEKTSTGAKITITDKNGTTTATVENGSDGAAGSPGAAGADGKDGSNGVTFTPSVSADGVISWTNDGGLQNPASVDMKKNNHAPIVTTAASKTLAAGDESSFIFCTNASAITITVPKGVFAIGTEIEISRFGAGTVTIAGASGVTINSVDSKKTIANQYGVAVLKQVVSNVWLLAGDLG